LWTKAAAESPFRQKTGNTSVGGEGKSGDVTIMSGKPGTGETFQWVDLQRGETLFLSLATHRYIVVPKDGGVAAADHPGPAPDRRDGSCFTWKPVGALKGSSR